MESKIITDEIVIQAVEEFSKQYSELDIRVKETGMPLSQFVKEIISDSDIGKVWKKKMVKMALMDILELVEKK